MFDNTNINNIADINNIISPISKGLKLSQFITLPPGRNAKHQLKRSGLLNLLQFNTVCCEDCLELVPGWKIDDNKVVADNDFADPKRGYGHHFDHVQTMPKEGEPYVKPSPPGDRYISPSQLCHRPQCDSERAENQLRITGTKCFG